MKILKKLLSVFLSACLLVCAVPVSASTVTDLPEKVVSELNLTANITASMEVTRAQFAQLLLNASSYKGVTDAAITYNLFSDVPAGHQYASAIYIASKEGWMTGFLGGTFKPDQLVTLREAMFGTIALLGYTNADFTGDQTQGRSALFYSKKLNDGINITVDSAINISQCTTLLYNLLKTTNKQGSLYGSIFSCKLDSDNEIDYLDLMSKHSNNISGPVKIKENKELDDVLPFKSSTATVYVDGESGGDPDNVLEGDLVFYSARTKTVWVYQDNITAGTVTGIGYDLSGSLTPTAVYVDGGEYLLEDDKMVTEFTTTKKVKVGNKITVVYDVQESNDGSGDKNILKGYLLD